MSADTIICDGGCGQPIFTFAGTTCGECWRRDQRALTPDSTKVTEWDAAMHLLDQLGIDTSRGQLRLTLGHRVQILAENM